MKMKNFESVQEVRIERNKEKERKIAQRKIELLKLCELFINQLIKLLNTNRTVYHGIQEGLIKKFILELPLVWVEEMSDEEFNHEYEGYYELYKDIEELVSEIEREAIASTFKYADVSLDDMILGMSIDAAEYNEQKKREKIGGGIVGGSSLGAFDEVRKKKNNNNGE